MKFHTLLYFSKIDNNPNLSKKHNRKKIHIYVKNAENLFLTLKKYNFELVILTNKPNLIKQHLDVNIKVIKINFSLYVPKKIKFYSAHFKVEALKYLSKLKYSCLIDSDILAIKKPPKFFLEGLSYRINMLYKIRKNVYSQKDEISQKILYSYNICNNIFNKNSEWYGGEFIVGDAFFFKSIYETILKIYPNYLKNFHNLYHQGDEMLLNSAIQLLKLNKNFIFKDISQKKIIARYWSINTIHKQKNFSYYLKNFLLHLPADKKFISELNSSNLSKKQVYNKVKTHISSKKTLLLNFIKKIIQTLN